MHTAIIEVGNKIDIRIVNQIENAKNNRRTATYL